MFSKEIIILIIGFFAGFIVMWPLSISARNKAKKEADTKKPPAEK